MFVHEDCPLLRGEAAEEAVGMGGAAGGSGGHEAVDRTGEELALLVEIPVVVDDEAFDGGRVAPDGIVVAEREGFDGPPDGVADQGAWRFEFSGGELEARCAVRHRLGRVHRSPLARAVWLQVREALFDVLRGGGVEEVFHDLMMALDGAMITPEELR